MDPVTACGARCPDRQVYLQIKNLQAKPSTAITAQEFSPVSGRVNEKTAQGLSHRVCKSEETVELAVKAIRMQENLDDYMY
jgi:hypothetical protein